MIGLRWHNLADILAANPELYDCKKFAHEALRLCAEIRRRYLAPSEQQGDIVQIEVLAHQTLSVIADAEIVLQKEGKRVFPPFTPILEDTSAEPGAPLREYNPKQIEGTCYLTDGPSFEDEWNQKEARKARFIEAERKRKLRPLYGKLQKSGGSSTPSSEETEAVGKNEDIIITGMSFDLPG